MNRNTRIKEYKATLAITKKRGVKGLTPRTARGGRAPKTAAKPLQVFAEGEVVVRVHQALSRLKRSDPRKAQVVTLRYLAGLSIEETAAALDVSAATVKNEWKVARAWLYRVLRPVDQRSVPITY